MTGFLHFFRMLQEISKKAEPPLFLSSLTSHGRLFRILSLNKGDISSWGMPNIPKVGRREYLRSPQGP